MMDVQRYGKETHRFAWLRTSRDGRLVCRASCFGIGCFRGSRPCGLIVDLFPMANATGRRRTTTAVLCGGSSNQPRATTANVAIPGLAGDARRGRPRTEFVRLGRPIEKY